MRSFTACRFGVVMPIVVSLIAACATPATCPGADDAERSQLLQTFVDELVPITPGVGQFPAELVLQPSEDAAESSQAARSVPLDGEFAIAKYEVPQNLYAAVMGDNPSKWTGPRNSVEMMTWTEAREFCRKLTQLLHDARLIEATEEIRLPTEIEWEYCCRAGTSTAYSFGDAAQGPDDEENKARLLDAYGWHTGNAAGNDPPVGALRPNPWGLYDVHGYLWEFCSDSWTAEVETGPAADAPPSRIVIRGGSWKDRFGQLRSASRRKFAVDARDDAVGIRCVRAPVPQS